VTYAAKSAYARGENEKFRVKTRYLKADHAFEGRFSDSATNVDSSYDTGHCCLDGSNSNYDMGRYSTGRVGGRGRRLYDGQRLYVVPRSYFARPP